MWQAVLFDLDNTLLDRDEAHERFCWHMVRRLSPDLPHEEHRRIVDDLLELDDSGYRPRPRYFRLAAERIGTDRITPGQYETLYYLEQPGFVRPNAPVIEMVRRIAKRFRVGLISNGPGDFQRRKIAAAGLDGLFTLMAFSSELGIRKPQPEIFLHVLSAFQIQPRQGVFIGDNPQRDIAGAAAVGLDTCWISNHRPYPNELPKPLWMVETILDVETRLPLHAG